MHRTAFGIAGPRQKHGAALAKLIGLREPEQHHGPCIIYSQVFDMQCHQLGTPKGTRKTHQEQGHVAGCFQRLLLVQCHQHFQQHIFGDGLDGALPGAHSAPDTVHGGLYQFIAFNR